MRRNNYKVKYEDGKVVVMRRLTWLEKLGRWIFQKIVRESND